MDNLEVHSFMPNIRRYFGHFTPTLRFLALRDPVGSSRQILYFIGFFPNLQDLKICSDFPREDKGGATDTNLVPLSIPPLCGRLTLTCFTREKLIKDMINLFGGLRFRYMDLFRVKCVRLLLGACADSLERLRLYPADPYGEEFLKKEGNSKKAQAYDPQKTTKPCAGLLICHGTLPFGRWRPQRYRSPLQATPLLVSSKPYSPPSRHLCPSNSLSTTTCPMSVVTGPLTFALGGYPRANGLPKPSFTKSDSRCSVRCMRYGSFDWCSVRTFWIIL